MARTFARGQLVEVCPYFGQRAFHYLAHMDGERGQVTGIKGHGDDLKVSVKLVNCKEPVEFPAQALKGIEPKAAK